MALSFELALDARSFLGRDDFVGEDLEGDDWGWGLALVGELVLGKVLELGSESGSWITSGIGIEVAGGINAGSIAIGAGPDESEGSGMVKLRNEGWDTVIRNQRHNNSASTSISKSGFVVKTSASTITSAP